MDLKTSLYPEKTHGQKNAGFLDYTLSYRAFVIGNCIQNPPLCMFER